MTNLTRRLAQVFLTICLSITGCTNSNQSVEPESKEAPKTDEIEPSIDPQSLRYQYQAEDLSLSELVSHPEYNRAIDLYTKAIEADPQNTCAYEGRANSYEGLEQYDKAIADLTQIVAIDPQYVAAYKKRASIYYAHLDKADKAVVEMDKAIALATQNKSESLSRFKHPAFQFCRSYRIESLYRLRALILVKLEEFDRAIADATQVIALRPMHTNYHFRAHVYRWAKQHKNAIADENKAITISSDYAHAYNRRANSYGQLKQYDKAIADYTKAISLYGDRNSKERADAYLGRANVYRELKQYDKAIADYDKSLAVYSQFAPAYKHRGELYKELGKIDLAKQDWSKAASLFKQQKNTEQYQIVRQQLQQL